MNTRTVHTQSKHTGRAAVVTAALAVSGIGITAFAIGVSGGSDADSPPAPDVPPAVEMEVPQGVDQRLYELAEKQAAEQRESGPGPDRRLYELADQYAAQLEAQRQPAPGPDRRLYELAEQYAEMRAQR
jgi:hypothetical protein